MATARTPIHYEKALNSLAQAIEKHRTTGLPREIARELLRYNNLGHNHLVGIDYAATKAIYFQCDDRFTVAVAFDESGLEDGGPKLATIRNESLQTWIDRWDVYWGWLFPRYR